jgi:NAD(P)-dependent dehydrogenase (short-subunit alcohol dehydrogenase family)
MRLDRRCAAITGIGSGVGRASELRFAEDGALVACVDLHGDAAQATAENCANAAVYLCSDESLNTTGVLMPVDGGYVAR